MNKKKILIIRNNSLGDISISLPLINAICKKYPEYNFIFLTKEKFGSLFKIFPKLSNLSFFLLKNYTKHKGFFGFMKLYKELKLIKFYKVADLHGVFRSQILCFLFRNFQKIETSIIKKYKKEKKNLIKKYYKEFKPIPSILNRYIEVFKNLGLEIEIKKDSSFPKKKSLSWVEKILGFRKNEKWIGIAPFAYYNEKTYPINKMERIIEDLNKKKIKIFIFGNGDYQKKITLKWSKNFKKVIDLIGKLDLSEELYIMNKLDLMITMDSSNMHLASIMNTRVISIWGPTHPLAGFYGYQQDISDAIQLSLPCRPCSIFGEKKCWRKDRACLKDLKENIILNKIHEVLKITL